MQRATAAFFLQPILGVGTYDPGPEDEKLLQDAITTYRQIMSEANAYNNTGYAALANGDLVQAKRFLNKAIKLSPTYFPQAEQNLAKLKELL